MCCYHRVFQQFWVLYVAVKDVLRLNCIPEHALNEYLTLLGCESVWEWSVHEMQSKGAVSNFSRAVISVGGILLLQDESLV